MVYLPRVAPKERGAGETKGSDKWGQGGGPRIRVEAILIALALISAAGVYYYYVESNALNTPGQVGELATISTTGIGCDDGSMPQAAQAVESDSSFTRLSAGLCYNFIGESSTAMTFAHYNGTITYPCGDLPLELPDSEILVNITSSQQLLSAQLLDTSQTGYQQEACDPSIPLKVVSVTDVESTIPAVPQLNLTLTVPPEGSPVASLEAVLTLDGGSQTFRFGSVTSTSPLRPSQSVSSIEIILSNLGFASDRLYPMAVSGTFANGQAFSRLVHVEIAQVP